MNGNDAGGQNTCNGDADSTVCAAYWSHGIFFLADQHVEQIINLADLLPALPQVTPCAASANATPTTPSVPPATTADANANNCDDNEGLGRIRITLRPGGRVSTQITVSTPHSDMMTGLCAASSLVGIYARNGRVGDKFTILFRTDLCDSETDENDK